MVCGSPGSARAISSRGTGLNPGPKSMPSAGANHGGKLKRAAAACGRSGSSARQGTTPVCAGGRCRMAVGCAGGAAQAKCRACAVGGGVKENEGGGGGGGSFLMVLQEDEGPQEDEESSPVSQRAIGVTFRY